MKYQKEKYKDRLIDESLKRYLDVFGAVSIEGPKWCGKTWTSIANSNSNISLANIRDRDRVMLDKDIAFEGDKPRLIDEWNLIPSLWDDTRNKCDEIGDKGNFILTCSTKLTDEEQKKQIKHSGAGRIGRLRMRTMSLYESSDSNGSASITDMYNGIQKSKNLEKIDIQKIARLIIRGGWPGNLENNSKNMELLPKTYIENILESDIHDNKKRNVERMKIILRSLARNESTIVNNKTITRDIEEIEGEENVSSIHTVEDYIDVLNRLHLINNQPAYNGNYRSKDRLGKSAKRHFTDPSLACAVLGLNEEKLLNDIKTFGFMFEALVERDLDVYMNYLGGKLYHFRDNVTGLEIDSILEFENGDIAAVEIKLGFNQYDEAKTNLMKFYNNMEKKPKFMCVICGNADCILRDNETGIYLLPITALKP